MDNLKSIRDHYFKIIEIIDSTEGVHKRDRLVNAYMLDLLETPEKDIERWFHNYCQPLEKERI